MWYPSCLLFAFSSFPPCRCPPGITSKGPLAFDSLFSLCLWRNLNQTGSQEPLERSKLYLIKKKTRALCWLLSPQQPSWLHHSGMHLCKHRAHTRHVSGPGPSHKWGTLGEICNSINELTYFLGPSRIPLDGWFPKHCLDSPNCPREHMRPLQL